jgi:hypothetical protein
MILETFLRGSVLNEGPVYRAARRKSKSAQEVPKTAKEALIKPSAFPQGLKPVFILLPLWHATQRVPRSCPFKTAT